MMNKVLTQKKTHGAALLLFVVLFMFISVAISFIVSRGVLGSVQEYSLLSRSKQSYFSAEALVEDVAYRNIAAVAVGTTESNTLFGSSASVSTAVDSVNGLLTITGLGNNTSAIRYSEMVLTQGSGASFNFGLQAGTGGIVMQNSSSVVGNVFANGTITGGGSSLVRGDAISAGSTGLIDGVHATGSAWAHTIKDATVDGNAFAYTLDDGIVYGSATYFNKINGAVVVGTDTGGVVLADQATATLPIPDSMVTEWQDYINASGTVISATSTQCSSGTYTIESNITLGKVRIDCNVNISKSSTIVTLDGPVWVNGNLSFSQSPTIQASPSVGNQTVQMFAYNPSNRTTSSKITVNQTTTFYGSGSPKSYVLLLSMNNSAELGGTEKAINLAQSTNGDVLVYAAHGLVDMGNSISLKEVTAYKITMGNNTEVIYESGLVNQLFTSGPGGGYNIADWSEI